MTPARVAVTGLGIRSPAGSAVGAVWSGLLGGRSSIEEVKAFVSAGIPVAYAGQVADFDDSAYLSRKESSRLDRGASLGYCAAVDALESAGTLDTEPDRRGVVFGCSLGGMATIESVLLAADNDVLADPSPAYLATIMPNATAAFLSIKRELYGPSFAVSTMCATGAHAIGEAARVIREGAADVMVAGASEAVLTPTVALAFRRAGALSKRAEPERASRPFDVERDGFVMAEGAGAVVLENYDIALARGATIHAELVGYGRSADGHHLTAPHPEGRGARTAMLQALADAGLSPTDIGHVNAHGTSTRRGDIAEALAIRSVFGGHRVPVTSTKGALGHTLAAAGAVEAIVSVQTLAESTIHPTANHVRTDPECDIDVVSAVPRPLSAGAVMSNSFGFGGHCVSLIFTGGATLAAA